ncbi:acyl-CoA dehydrogenase family protein [Dactylosporangium sp. NPDC050588]|uniref:acyl-CoA dehydrogenase family protein n=1 Tax=Dactylosporangium sp. NPDC050588 TaxID=3157211 RepID=UPI0033DC3375
MVTTSEVPDREELVRRAAALRPTLRARTGWAEEHRRLHDETIEALADAGLFKLRTPKRYGGYAADATTLVDVATELGHADSSASWVTAVYWIPTWMAGLFPQAVQDEVFSTPDVRICGTLSPSALARSAEGGIVVNGKWGFISGAHHAHWQEIIAILAPESGEPYPVMALVPMSDLLVVDDWHTSGLRGTGSVSTVAQELFIPQERVVPLPAVLQGSAAGAGAEAMHQVPLLPVASASSVGTVLGMTRAAKESFFKRLPNRKITYTGYDSQRDAPLTHFQVAEAATKSDQAAFHAHRLATTVDEKAAAGLPWKLEERARARHDMGTAVRLAKEAVDILASASGGSSVYQDVPIQRIAHDLHTINLHALMNPNTNAELYGRVLCGLEPNTLYI